MTHDKFPILPEKPSGNVSEDPIASGEWDRVIELLSRRKDLAEVGECVVRDAAQAYAAVAAIAKQVEITGRHEDVTPMLDDLAEMLDMYRRTCAELGVEPAPLARLHEV